MSELLHSRPIAVTDSASLLGFMNDGPALNPRFNRYLTLEGKQAYQVGYVCDTCPFLFERLGGANQKVSPATLSSAFRAGLDRLDADVVDAARALLPDGDYHACLMRLTPRLATPGAAEDYFAHEQIALWGLDSFWGLPHDPRIIYYRGGDRPLGDGRGLFEFVVPMYPPNWLDSRTMAEYQKALDTGAEPTAFAISVLDVKQPSTWTGDPDTNAHWCLAHYLLDGHHKTYAAALAGQPLTVLTFLSTTQSLASENDTRNLLEDLRVEHPRG